MASIADLAGKRLYLDTNVFVYALEALTPWAGVAQRLLEGVDNGKWSGVSSELTLAECLIKPLQRGQHENVRRFEQAVQSRQHLSIIPVGRAILIEGARLRAGMGLKLPDAIHLATVQRAECALLITNDSGLARHAKLDSILLSEIAEE